MSVHREGGFLDMPGPKFLLRGGYVRSQVSSVGWVCPGAGMGMSSGAGISKGKWVHPRRKWVYRTKVGIPEGVGGG